LSAGTKGIIVLDKVDEAPPMFALVSGQLKQDIAEELEEAKAVCEGPGSPEVEFFDVPGLPGSPLRLEADTRGIYELLLVNDDLRVGIGTSRPPTIIRINSRGQVLPRGGLEDLEQATNAIASHFMREVLFLEHAYHFMARRLLKDLGETSPDQGE
jgi:hypothetical protein